jgi:hypothetical protein
MNIFLNIPMAVFILGLLCVTGCKKGEESKDPAVTAGTIKLLPDTGQTTGYTSTPGEDADYTINSPSFTDNGDGTVTDNITGLMWQKTDGGEMTFENAASYCNDLVLGGFSDWRLPTCMELFSINNLGKVNPALFTMYFTSTTAEYWWCDKIRADDITKVWVVNAGGGIGAHPKSETVSAGGTKSFNTRAVRYHDMKVTPEDHFTDNSDGTVTDNFTELSWQKVKSSSTYTWEEALVYANDLSLANFSDWRLPNIKELQSLNDESLFKPSFNKTFFTGIISGNFWSVTTLIQSTGKAWDINVDYGIVSYNDKTLKENIICVRGGKKL